MPNFINDYVIEIPEIDFDPTDPRWVELYQSATFKEYPGWEGDGYPFQTCSTDVVQNSTIVQWYIEKFSFLDLRSSNYISTKTTPGDGGDAGARNSINQNTVKGTLIKGDLSVRSILPHVDATRTTGILFPLTFPQYVNFYKNEPNGNDPIYVHEYKPVITIINTASWHGVSQTAIGNPRYQLQLDCYNSWEEMSSLINTL